MNGLDYYKLTLSKYAEFDGRSRRSEHWYFFLGNSILTIVTQRIDSVTGLDIVNGILLLILLVPRIAVATRRLHDTGRSGWWLLLAFTGIGIFVLLFWFVQDSDPGNNEYGSNPKYDSSDDVTDHLVDEDLV